MRRIHGKRMKKNVFLLPTVLAVIFTVIILLGSFIWFSANTDAMIESTTSFYLETNARSQAAAFQTKLSSYVEFLELAARAWSDIDMEDSSVVMDNMSRMKVFGNFSKVTVIMKDGRMIDSGRNVLGDFSKTPFFSRAMEGLSTISDSVQYGGDDGDFLTISVPIISGGETKGIMYGQFPLSALGELIEAVGFQQTSTSLLLSGDGTILARSSGSSLVTDRILNFYDLGTSWGIDGEKSLVDVKLDIIGGKTFTIPYQSGSRERLAILTPVNMNGWYYAIIISQEVIHAQSKTLSLNLLIVVLMLSFAFVLLFLAILNLIRQNSIVEMANDRFRIVTTQTQTIVFDYDFLKGRIELNGNASFISPSARESYSHDEILRILCRILHENDRSVVSELKSIYESRKQSIMREMRIMCADGNYYWYKMTGTVIRNEDGEPIRFVGNFVNVEDDVMKEEILKKKAERDTLSGLLNKGAFTNYVTRELYYSKNECCYAFYIIDLDNFKKVNDTLGHIVGDHVISSVSQKICTVFSENDFVGRIGGDEFAVFMKLPALGKQQWRGIIGKKAAALCKFIDEVYSDGKSSVRITSSIGISLYPYDGRNFEELYGKADLMLYNSKNSGKNKFSICE